MLRWFQKERLLTKYRVEQEYKIYILDDIKLENIDSYFF